MKYYLRGGMVYRQEGGQLYYLSTIFNDNEWSPSRRTSTELSRYNVPNTLLILIGSLL